jgi:hypothetical protein
MREVWQDSSGVCSRGANRDLRTDRQALSPFEDTKIFLKLEDFARHMNQMRDSLRRDLLNP